MADLVKFADEIYLRAEDLLVDGKYQSATLEIEAVLVGAPLTRRLKPYAGLALKFKGKDKVLGLGLTNECMCKVICRDARPTTWAGNRVRLEVRSVPVLGSKTNKQPAIRIMPEKGTEMRSGLIRQLGAPIQETNNANV